MAVNFTVLRQPKLQVDRGMSKRSVKGRRGCGRFALCSFPPRQRDHGVLRAEGKMLRPWPECRVNERGLGRRSGRGGPRRLEQQR